MTETRSRLDTSKGDTTDHDYCRDRVPDGATVGGFHIALVIFGIGITLPVFFVGSKISQALGLAAALWVFILACGAVGGFMVITSLIGSRTRMTTYLVLGFPFGRQGAKVVNLLIAVTLVGYFSATGDIFGEAVGDAIASLYGWRAPKLLFTLSGCALMTLTAIFGFRVLERFSLFAVPILAVFMLYVVYLALSRSSWDAILIKPGASGMSFGEAVSMVIGTNILMVVLSPDFARFARTDGDAIKSVAGLAVGYPIIMLVSGIPTMVIGETDIMKIMIDLGVALPALYILVFSTWTTNTVNLYSAVLTLATIFTKTKGWKLGIAASLAGSVGAAIGLMDYFLPFVLFLGVATTPVAAIYVTDYFFIRRQNYDLGGLDTSASVNQIAFLAWLVSAAVGSLSSVGLITLTNFPAFDSLLIAFTIYLLAARFSPRRSCPKPEPVDVQLKSRRRK